MGLYLAQPCVKLELSHVPLPHPSHFKPGLLAAVRVDGPEWSTPRKFYCCHIREQMSDNVCEHLSFTFLSASFLERYSSNILFICADCYDLFFRLINHNTRKRTSEYIHQISLATFAVFASMDDCKIFSLPNVF